MLSPQEFIHPEDAAALRQMANHAVLIATNPKTQVGDTADTAEESNNN